MSRLLGLGSRLPKPARTALKSLPGFERLRARLAGTPRGPAPSSGQLRPLVYLPTWAQWDVMRQRPQYVVRAFAALGHEVYFVDPREPGPRTVDGVTIVPSLSLLPPRSVILYTHYAPLHTMFDLFEDPVVIYDIHDDLTIFDADELHLPDERRVAAHHAAALAAAEVVMVSLDVLADRHRPEAPDLIVVENGVDPSLFRAEHPRPVDLPRAKPLVGYHGAVSYWFDFDLLAGVARARPEWPFCLVGPVDPRVSDEAERLALLPNVVLLGERPSDVIPAYVQGFDVGTIWFRRDHMTEAVSPLKLYECLAVPIPVVSTSLPAAVASPVVRTGDHIDSFVVALEAALQDATRPEFHAAATAEADRASWTRRIAPVRQRLEELDRLRVS